MHIDITYTYTEEKPHSPLTHTHKQNTQTQNYFLHSLGNKEFLVES